MHTISFLKFNFMFAHYRNLIFNELQSRSQTFRSPGKSLAVRPSNMKKLKINIPFVLQLAQLFCLLIIHLKIKKKPCALTPPVFRTVLTELKQEKVLHLEKHAVLTTPTVSGKIKNRNIFNEDLIPRKKFSCEMVPRRI